MSEKHILLRNLWILAAGVILAIAVAALVISLLAILPSSDDEEPETRLVDRNAFTVQMVLDALAYYDLHGLDDTLDFYNSPQSIQGDWYVFIIDQDDKMIAHAHQDFLGLDLKGALGVDSTGYRFGDLLLTATDQGLWVDYLFLNPATGNTEYKHSWVVKHDGIIFGSGWYQVLPSPPTPLPEEEEVLTLLYWQAPSIPNPYLSGGSKDVDAAAVTLEPLAKYNPDGILVPALATEIPTIENGGVSQDLTSITWKLKEDLRWSDASPLTAHDVVFTYEYCVDEATGCTARSSFADITSVEALDELTVKITFHEHTPYPYVPFVSSGNPIISRSQFGDCVGEKAAGCVDQNYAPLGSGPYRIIEFTPEQQAVYERNPFFRGEEPYFDRVVIKGGGDALTAARNVLELGIADFAWNLQIAPDTLVNLEALGKGNVGSAFSSLVERIVINQTNPDPALGDARSEYMDGANPHPFLTFTPIPQAMSMAIDRALISNELYGFAGKPTCNLIVGPYPYVSTANDGCLVQNIDGANLLLDNNNVIDTDGDGIREYNGIPLRLTFQTSTNDVRQQTQQLIKDWWAQIGIDTQIIHHDAAVFFGGDPIADKESLYTRFFTDVQMYATGPDIDPQQYLFGLTCDQVPTAENHWGGSNTARACNPQFDELVERLAHAPLTPGRDALIKRMNDFLVQRYYELPLVNRGSVSAYLNTLKGVQVNGWDTDLWNIAEWRR